MVRLAAQYDAVLAEDHVVRNTFICFSLAVAIKFVFMAFLFYEANLRVEPIAPMEAEPLEPLAAALVADKAEGDSSAEERGRPSLMSEEVLGGEGNAGAGSAGAQLTLHNVSLWLDAPPESKAAKESDAKESGAKESQVGEGHQYKYLLRDVSAMCCKGEVLSIMGPSGAGKTTLLNLVMCEQRALPGKPEDISGDVMLNGMSLEPHLFRDHCAYVPQNDVGLFTFLSTEDHVRPQTRPPIQPWPSAQLAAVPVLRKARLRRVHACVHGS